MIKKCCAKFRRQFPGISVPYKLTIQKLVKLQTTGSLLNKKHVVAKKVHTGEKLDDIGAKLEHSPKKWLRQLAQQYVCMCVCVRACVCVCFFFTMPTRCTITRFGFRAGRIDGVKCDLVSNHAPLGQTTLLVGRVSV